MSFNPELELTNDVCESQLSAVWTLQLFLCIIFFFFCGGFQCPAEGFTQEQAMMSALTVEINSPQVYREKKSRVKKGLLMAFQPACMSHTWTGATQWGSV